jgi:hypothetical protein
MKHIFRLFCLVAMFSIFNAFSIAQDDAKKTESFNKIAKLFNSKKTEDKEKAFKEAKDFLAKYGTGTDEKVTKIKDAVEAFELDKFNAYLNEGKTDDAFLLGKEMLERKADNTYITMNLALGGLEAFEKKKDDSFAGDSINFAKQTIQLLAAGKAPKTFQPIKDQAEANALMYYIIGIFSADVDDKESANSFLKSTTFDSIYKTNSFVYYKIAAYYDKMLVEASKNYQVKHGAKTKEDAEMKADNEKLDKILDRVIDAYARAVKYAETDKNPSIENWKNRLKQIYVFRKQSEAGLTEYINNVLSSPMPEIL